MTKGTRTYLSFFADAQNDNIQVIVLFKRCVEGAICWNQCQLPSLYEVLDWSIGVLVVLCTGHCNRSTINSSSQYCSSTLKACSMVPYTSKPMERYNEPAASFVVTTIR